MIILITKLFFLQGIYLNRDLQARAKIRNRLKRVESGNLGNYRSVGGGAEIYTLIEFLDALGYRIALAPKDNNSFSDEEL